MMKLLVDERGSEIEFTSDVLEVVAKNQYFGKDIMKFLLEKKGIKVHLTPGIICAAVYNAAQSLEITLLLLRHLTTEPLVPHHIIEAILSIDDWDTEGIMEFLLKNQFLSQESIKQVLEALTTSTSRGHLEHLLSLPGVETTISSALIQAAAKNKVYGHQIAEVLLRKYGDKIKITSELIRNLAADKECRENFVNVLLAAQRDVIQADRDLELFRYEKGRLRYPPFPY